MDLFQKNIIVTAKKNNDNRHGDIASISKTLMMTKGLHLESSFGGPGSAGGGGGGGSGEGAGIRRKPLVPLIPPGYLGSSRPPSRLERSLLPGFKTSPILLGDPNEKAQLTIFYAGMINVYDNVPADKAQSILLLANQCSVEPPQAQNNVTKADVTKPIPRSHSPSFASIPQDLPIARRHSLRRFLEKRRDRIANKFPYASSDDR